MKQFFPAKGGIYYVAIATVIFSRVKISCFRAKAHPVFHWYWCLYNNTIYSINCRAGGRGFDSRGWGPFLESPGNFSGPKSNIQIEILE